MITSLEHCNIVFTSIMLYTLYRLVSQDPKAMKICVGACGVMFLKFMNLQHTVR